MTKLNFYFQKLWKDFGDCKYIKTRAMCNACTKAEQYLLYTLDSHTLIGKHEKELDEKDSFVQLCKLCLNCVSNSNINHKKYQITIAPWLFGWQIDLIWVQSNGLPWTTCVFLKAVRMVKHVTFLFFSAILLFENILKGPIQYSLVQIH